MIGPDNEADVIVEGIHTTALVNTGVKVSNIAKEFVDSWDVKVCKMKRMIHLEGMAGFTVPYSGYIKVEIGISTMGNYRENALMLVFPDSCYTERVPLQVDTGILNRVMENIMQKELTQASNVWKQTYLSTILAKLLVHENLNLT